MFVSYIPIIYPLYTHYIPIIYPLYTHLISYHIYIYIYIIVLFFNIIFALTQTIIVVDIKALLLTILFTIYSPPLLIWLVVWKMNFIFPNSWDDDPIGFSYFSGG